MTASTTATPSLTRRSRMTARVPMRRSARLHRRCRERAIVFTVVPTNSYYLRTLPKERWRLTI
ncbi:MAG: hypothetical protein U1F49_06535 [Rubrivivax sp.]